MPFASRRSLRPLALGLAVTGLVVAGTAGAYFLRSRRDVTTSSEKAWRAYHEARENDLKMYEREAISGYAAALQEDPHFVMATLRLADKMRGRDPERAKSLLASAARYRDEITRARDSSCSGSTRSAGAGATWRSSASSSTSTSSASRTIRRATGSARATLSMVRRAPRTPSRSTSASSP